MNRKGADRVGALGGSGLVALWGSSSLIRSVQYFSGTVNAATTNFTITAVDTANAIAFPLGISSTYATANIGVCGGGVALTTATNVAFTRLNWSGNTASGVVVEFAPGLLKSLQIGSINLGAAGLTTATATVTAVNTDKSVLLVTGNSSNGDNTSGPDTTIAYLSQTNSTTITATRGAASATYYPIPRFALLEFF
jgi:hypothetical protein